MVKVKATSVASGTKQLIMIKEMETSISAGNVKDYNGMMDLLKHLNSLKSGQDELGLQSLHALRRILLILIHRGDIQKPPVSNKKSRPDEEIGTTTDGARKRPRTEVSNKSVAAEDDDTSDKALHVFQVWMYDQYQSFIASLLSLLDADELRTKVVSLRTLMEFVKVESIVRRKPQACFGHDLFMRIIDRLLHAAPSLHSEVVEVLRVNYVTPYMDVRYWLVRALKLSSDKSRGDGKKAGGSNQQEKKKRAREENGEEKGHAKDFIAATFKLLMLVTLPANADAMAEHQLFVSLEGVDGSNGQGGGDVDGDPYDSEAEYDEEAEEDVSAGKRRPLVTQWTAHQKALSEAWLSCLRCDLTPALYRSTPQFIVRNVIDVMINPLQLSDFLTSSYSQGGLTSLVALEGLFSLMQKHNLEYPRFYSSLYKLLTPQAMYSRHRPRFFCLLRLCLQSTHVPAYVVAAFMKRLCRLALLAPSPTIIFILGLCSSLLRKHPECKALVHRPPHTTSSSSSSLPLQLDDTFNATADDPAEALKDGMNTSLWEVQALQRHYYSATATLAKGLEISPEDPKALSSTSAYDLDEFARYSYATLFGQELKRRMKETPLAFQKAKGQDQHLFQSGDYFEGIFELAKN